MGGDAHRPSHKFFDRIQASHRAMEQFLTSVPHRVDKSTAVFPTVVERTFHSHDDE